LSSAKRDRWGQFYCEICWNESKCCHLSISCCKCSIGWVGSEAERRLNWYHISSQSIHVVSSILIANQRVAVIPSCGSVHCGSRYSYSDDSRWWEILRSSHSSCTRCYLRLKEVERLSKNTDGRHSCSHISWNKRSDGGGTCCSRCSSKISRGNTEATLGKECCSGSKSSCCNTI
jgi:hypothetical protein